MKLNFLFFSLQVSGLALFALFLWTYISHASFLAIIPNLTYKIVLYMTFATSVAILVTFILGVIAVSIKVQGKKCIVPMVSPTSFLARIKGIYAKTRNILTERFLAQIKERNTENCFQSMTESTLRSKFRAS